MLTSEAAELYHDDRDIVIDDQLLNLDPDETSDEFRLEFQTGDADLGDHNMTIQTDDDEMDADLTVHEE